MKKIGGIIGLVFLGSVFGGLDTHNQIVKTNSQISQHPSTQIIAQLNMAGFKLGEAQDKLSRRNYLEYPDGAEARYIIEESVKRFKRIETKEKATDIHLISSKLIKIRDSLPDEDGIQSYKGKKVDETTFEKQIKELEEITEKEIPSIETYFKAQLKPLERERDSYQKVYLFFFYTGLASGIAGLFYLGNKLYESDKGKLY
ncbi:hypothetical protein HZA33_02270 [Candidatus Pacearchaeota archaeon]|nr:hypothetical protein [Candidatus Pacearchaeota archaeon]